MFPCEVIKSVGVVFWLQCTYKVQLCHLLGLTHQCSMPVRRDCFLVVAQLALRQPSSLFTVPCGVRMDEIDIRTYVTLVGNSVSCLRQLCSLNCGTHLLFQVAGSFVCLVVSCSEWRRSIASALVNV